MLSTKSLARSVLKSCVEINRRGLYVSAARLIREHRINRGEPANANKSGPLTDLPDFKYLDGRPTPIGSRQKTRMMTNRENAKRIVDLISHVDFAKNEFKRKQLEKEEDQQKIIANRLKEKGDTI